jgi:hypothetical protein
MGLDRGVLARIDRKLLAGLGQDEAFHIVRVPATEAKWSTWKRYCGAAGTSMGQAISVLVDRELTGVFGEPTTNEVAVFARQAHDELTDRQRRLNVRDTGRLRLRAQVCQYASTSAAKHGGIRGIATREETACRRDRCGGAVADSASRPGSDCSSGRFGTGCDRKVHVGGWWQRPCGSGRRQPSCRAEPR